MSLWKHRYLSTHKVTIYSHHKTDEILLFWTYIGCTFSRCWQCRSFDAVMNLVMETRQTKPADSAIVAELFAYSRWVLSPGPPPATENFMQQQTSSGKKKEACIDTLTPTYWFLAHSLASSCLPEFDRVVLLTHSAPLSIVIFLMWCELLLFENGFTSETKVRDGRMSRVDGRPILKLCM